MTRRILCVDDDESVRSLLRHLLTEKGHSVCVAHDGAQAIAHANVVQFDAIITGHQMPQMIGLELVRQLRANAYPGKIFVFSGALSQALRKEYEALKVDMIAAKPTGLKDILALLEMPSPISPASPRNPSPESANGAIMLRCPNGKQCRLTLVNEKEMLVYCSPIEPGICPNAMSFAGTSFCRALMGSKKSVREN